MNLDGSESSIGAVLKPSPDVGGTRPMNGTIIGPSLKTSVLFGSLSIVSTYDGSYMVGWTDLSNKYLPNS